MKVFHNIALSRIEYVVKFDDGEDRERSRFSGKTNFYFDFSGINFSRPHPDKLALVAILNLLPFADKKMEIMWGVSDRFKEACRIISRVDVSIGSSEIVQEYQEGRDLVPCISFSGGADSTAALAVMPSITECVFLHRTFKKGRTLYDSDAAIESCRKLSALGYRAHIVESDLEFLREPVGFPTDLAVGSPAILLSDTRKYSSIAFGTILESAFGTSGERFREYKFSSHYKLWSKLFEAAGVGYSLPIAGVSEVGSTIICERHPLGKIHQSCIRGKWGRPCEKCWKCFRKSALVSAIRGSDEEIDYIGKILDSKEVWKKVIEESPIRHEGVLTYSFTKTKYADSYMMDLLCELVRVGEITVDWMEKWFPDSTDLIHDSYRGQVVEKLEKFLGKMDSEDVLSLREWENTDDELRSSKRAKLQDLLI